MPVHHRQQHPVRDRAARVTDGVQRRAGGRLDPGEVVAAVAHHRPQASIGRPGLLRGGGRLGPLTAQLGVQRQDVLDDLARQPGADPQRRQAEIGPGRIALRLLQGDLQLGAAARRLAPHQFVGRHGQRGGQRLDQRQFGLAAAVLQERQDRRRPADLLAELGQRETAGTPDMAQPLAEHAEVETSGSFRQGLLIFTCEDVHLFTITKFSPNFRTDVPSLPWTAEAAWMDYPGTTPPGGPVMNDRRLEGTLNGSASNGSAQRGSASSGAANVDNEAAALDRQWEADPRWAGIERTYSAADVIRLRGSVQEEHTLARLGAERLWSLLNSGGYVNALGALTGNQAVQQVKAGLQAIYLSGWQVAADA